MTSNWLPHRTMPIFSSWPFPQHLLHPQGTRFPFLLLNQAPPPHHLTSPRAPYEWWDALQRRDAEDAQRTQSRMHGLSDGARLWSKTQPQHGRQGSLPPVRLHCGALALLMSRLRFRIPLLPERMGLVPPKHSRDGGWGRTTWLILRAASNDLNRPIQFLGERARACPAIASSRRRMRADHILNAAFSV